MREFRPTTVYDRYALLPGAAFDGPAIVEERESSLVIGPGGRFQVAASGNIIVATHILRISGFPPAPARPAASLGLALLSALRHM